MARKAGVTNDQGELIEFIKKGDRPRAWESIKFVGFNDVQDIEVRFLVFSKVFDSFDPFRNNNFILYYKNQLRYHKMNIYDKSQYKLTSNRTVINILKAYSCSPTEELPEIVEQLQEFI